MLPNDFESLMTHFRAESDQLEQRLADPELFSHPAEFRRISRERGRLSSLLSGFDAWKKLSAELQDSREALQQETDAAFRALLEETIPELEQKTAELEKKVLHALIPPEKTDDRNTIIEIKPAAGGEEAALFASEIFRMYQHYAEKRNWKCEILDQSHTELGGIRNAVFSLSGDRVFSFLKYESGVHRVQRVPATEASGRIHTSTITVSVLPEADELDDLSIRPEDLEISTFRSSGPGGQNVNKTDSAVRIVHKPSGITVASQQERSQLRNREIALRILKAKLLEKREREEAEKRTEDKRRQVGTGDRSERIRTYNFPQNRVTDHRYGITVYHLPDLMEGDLDLILDPIRDLESAAALAELQKA